VIRWSHVEGQIAEVVERWCARERRALPPDRSIEVRVLRDNARRRVVVLRDPCCQPLVIKHFRSATGRHALRERFKRFLGYAAAEREFVNLRYLVEHGVRVPKPLGLGSLPEGDLFLVVPYHSGSTLKDMKRSPEWHEILHEVGVVVGAMHRAGLVHRDLHASNILLTEAGPMLLDLQRARKTRSARARMADLGWLDASLMPSVSVCDRLRVREAALGVARPWDQDTRSQLEAVGLAARAHLADYARGRTRRALIEGRRYARVAVSQGRGLRLRSLDENTVSEIGAAHRAALTAVDGRVLKNEGRSRVTRVKVDGRAFVVKERIEKEFGRQLVNGIRGSAAKRGWVAGHGLRYRGLGAPEPQAFLETRRMGLCVSSLLIMEDLAPAVSGYALSSQDVASAEVLRALAKLVLRLHERSVDHADLKAGNIFFRIEPSGVRTFLIDLEDVRFRKQLSESKRVLALAQLNASLGKDYPSRERCDWFRRYAWRHPFRDDSAALREIVRISLAREHFWKGEDCEVAADLLEAKSKTDDPKVA